MVRARQQAFDFKPWGGARTGSGRKRQGTRRNVRHRSRAALAARHPVHVTLRLEAGLASLRGTSAHPVVRAALAKGSSRFGMRIVHYSVMTNHLHLVCEAPDERALSRGIKGLCVRIARGVNSLWRRRGRVFADRYHTHVLKTPREVRHALAYVLRNASHHKIQVVGPDPCSSGAWFDGWRRITRAVRDFVASPLPAAQTWLLTRGWRRHGLIELELHVH